MKTIITAGANTDTDVLACAVAYAELLRLEGGEAVPVVSDSFTSSVTPSILEWGGEYQTEYEPDGTENFVLVDISAPEHFPAFVSHDRISEVYDHRHGHEDYWQDRLKEHAHVEMVGSCGTLIWEQFKKRGKEKDISMASAKLLLASIVSNTLAFRSPLTTERDRSAYAELSASTGLGEEWIAKYFREQETLLLNDFERYVRADLKVYTLAGGDFVIGQIEMWDATDLLKTKKAELDAILAGIEPTPWFVNILNISKGYSFVYSKSPRGKELFEEKVKITFNNDIATADDLLMRKYLMKLLRE